MLRHPLAVTSRVLAAASHRGVTDNRGVCHVSYQGGKVKGAVLLKFLAWVLNCQSHLDPILLETQSNHIATLTI